MFDGADGGKRENRKMQRGKIHFGPIVERWSGQWDNGHELPRDRAADVRINCAFFERKGERKKNWVSIEEATGERVSFFSTPGLVRAFPVLLFVFSVPRLVQEKNTAEEQLGKEFMLT